MFNPKLSADHFFFGFFLAGLFMPFAISTLALFILLVYWTLVGIKKASKRQLDLFSLAQIGFWIFTLLSVFWSDNKAEAQIEIFAKLPFLLVPLALFFARNHIKNQRKSYTFLIWFSAVAISILCFLSVFYRIATYSGVEPLDYSWVLTYESLAKASGMQPIYLSMFLIIGMIAWYDWAQQKEKLTLLHLSTPVFLFVVIAMLSSRTEFAVCLILLGFTGWRYFTKHPVLRKRLVWIGAGVVAVAVSVIFSNPVNRSRFLAINDFGKQSETWGSTSLRIEKWKNTLECMGENWFYGTGAGDYEAELLKTYSKNGFDLGVKEHFNSHNQYLQTWLTLGSIGLGLLILFFFKAFQCASKSGDLVFKLLLICFTLSMLTESLLERQPGLFIIVVLMNVFYAFSYRE
jgi:hypothetical protein